MRTSFTTPLSREYEITQTLHTYPPCPKCVTISLSLSLTPTLSLSVSLSLCLSLTLSLSLPISLLDHSLSFAHSLLLALSQPILHVYMRSCFALVNTSISEGLPNILLGNEESAYRKRGREGEKEREKERENNHQLEINYIEREGV